MSFTATATQGHELVGHVTEEHVLYLPGDPGVTFARGDRCYFSNGVLALATDSIDNTEASPAIYVVQKSTVCPAASTAFPIVYPGAGITDLNGDAAKTLVPVIVDIPVGTRLWKCNFYGGLDDTVITYSAASRYVALTTGCGADDRPNGALAYVYEGPGKGEINVVEDYDHTGGAVELMLVFHRPFNATLTSSSKLVILGTFGSVAQKVGFGSRFDLYDEDQIDVNDGNDTSTSAIDGRYTTYMDFIETGILLDKGQLKYFRSCGVNLA